MDDTAAAQNVRMMAESYMATVRHLGLDIPALARLEFEAGPHGDYRNVHAEIGRVADAVLACTDTTIVGQSARTHHEFMARVARVNASTALNAASSEPLPRQPPPPLPSVRCVVPPEQSDAASLSSSDQCSILTPDSPEPCDRPPWDRLVNDAPAGTRSALETQSFAAAMFRHAMAAVDLSASPTQNVRAVGMASLQKAVSDLQVSIDSYAGRNATAAANLRDGGSATAASRASTAATATAPAAGPVPLYTETTRPETEKRFCAAEFTQPFCSFIAENPTVWHTVDHFKSKLVEASFQPLSPRDVWSGGRGDADKVDIRPGGRYVVTRNGSSLIAIVVGDDYEPGDGIAMVGAHVDAVTARLKPVSDKPTKDGYVQLGVAPYAGGLNSTWWDRDLSIGGRVIVRGETRTESKLVKLGWPIARIPSLAPHFGVGIMGQNNAETQAVPIIGLDSTSPSTAGKKLGPDGCFARSQPPRLVELVAGELGISPDQYGSILGWDLELYDSQPAQTGGLDREFIFAGRVDDKLCAWSAVMGLLAAADKDAANTPLSRGIQLVALFDNEEIGSLARQGARSNFLATTVERVVEALARSAVQDGNRTYHRLGTDDDADAGLVRNIIGQTYSRSFLLSADVIHAVHPNFDHLYLADHAPRLNVGVVLSSDSNGHMTTDAVSAAIVRRVGERGGGVVQNFQIRNDSRSGGTIGPSIASALGVRAADVGLPQLSMHSIRATTGALDPGLGVRFFKTFLEDWQDIDAEWTARNED